MKVTSPIRNEHVGKRCDSFEGREKKITILNQLSRI